MLISWNQHLSKGKSQVGNFPTLIGVFPSGTRLLTFPLGSYGSSITDNGCIIKVRRDKVFAYVLHSTYPTLFLWDFDEQSLSIQGAWNLLKLTLYWSLSDCRSHSSLHLSTLGYSTAFLILVSVSHSASLLQRGWHKQGMNCPVGPTADSEIWGEHRVAKERGTQNLLTAVLTLPASSPCRWFTNAAAGLAQGRLWPGHWSVLTRRVGRVLYINKAVVDLGKIIWYVEMEIFFWE